MVQQLRVIAALLQESAVPCTPVEWLTTDHNSSCSGPSALFWPLRAFTYIYVTYVETRAMQKNKRNGGR